MQPTPNIPLTSLPHNPPQQQQQQQAFGLIISGCPIRTDFTPVDASGLKFACRLTCPGDIPAPLATVSDVVLFLLPNVPLPPNHGVLCYWQLTSSDNVNTTGFELLGALIPDEPSRIFYTGFGEHEQLIEITASGAAVALTIGLSLEPLSNIDNILASSGLSSAAGADRRQNRLWIAQKIGSDLFRFMRSFDTGAAGPGNLVVPSNIFDRWFERFRNRLQRNPNFFLKHLDEE